MKHIIIIDNFIKVSTNKIYSGVNYRTRTKHKHDYLLLTKNILEKLNPITKKVNIKFTFYFTKNIFDSSNCSYMGKILEDCLVHYKVLKDDTTEYVGNVTYESIKSKERNINWCLIEISELDD